MRGAMADQSIDGFPGPLAAVENNRQENINGSATGRFARSTSIRPEQFFEQVKSAMNVADGG